MMKVAIVGIVGVIVLAGVAYAMMPKQTTPKNDMAKSLADFEVVDIKGEKVSLKKFVGKSVLIVNVASKCGNTPQYAGLEALNEKYKDKGLVVLGFPCNQFGGQEPGTESEILEFCQKTYDVKFQMFSKVDVKGENAAPLYKWLVHSTENQSDVEWNFAKFLVAKDGKSVKRFGARTQPESDEVVGAIESSLTQ
ncbi:MAG: glutathione peroxidase [Fimbriimonadaceae bacterium]